jgi:hypothetical protein
MRLAGNIACKEAMRNVCRILDGKPEGKRTLGRASHGWGIILISI